MTLALAVVPSEGNSLWQFFSYQFVHSSALHWLSNVWYLLVFGWIIENALGKWRMGFLFLLGGALAVVPEIYLRVHESQPIVGASGSVAALIGAVSFLFPTAKVRLWMFLIPVPGMPSSFFIPVRFLVAFWLAMQLSGYFAHLWIEPSSVAYATHLAGFGVGALAGIFWRKFRVQSVDIDLSGRELQSFYDSLEAYRSDQHEKANQMLREISLSNRWMHQLQDQLYLVSLHFRQKELSDALLKLNRMFLGRQGQRRFEAWRTSYAKLYGEEPQILGGQGAQKSESQETTGKRA